MEPAATGNIREVRMKVNNMIMMVAMCGLVLLSYGNGGGSTHVLSAFNAFLDEPYFRQPKSIGRVLEFGLPHRIRETPSFTNLVAVISNEVGECFGDWKALATNNLNRALFRTALAESGPDVYTCFVTNALDKSALQGMGYGSLELVEYMSAVCTRLENYYMLNYAQPGISNLWLRARAIFEAKGLPDSVKWVDEVLSGERRWMYDHLDSIDYGPGVYPKPYEDGTW